MSSDTHKKDFDYPKIKLTLSAALKTA